MDEHTHKQAMTRRQFVRWLTAAGLGATLLSCDNPTPAPSQGAQATSTPLASPTSPPVARATNTPLPSPASPEVAQATNPPGATSTSLPAPATETAPPPPAPSPTPREAAYLAVARGGDPKAITRAAVAALGGIERFVKAGDDVIVKPNICVDYRSYEYAATTNPEVVAALVELCLGAGAKHVRVMDNPFGGSPESAYARSGIAEAVAAAGGRMEAMVPAKFRETDIPEGRDIRRWPVYQGVLAADVVINVPIAKHHNLARLTLGGKNLMGVIQNRGGIHRDLGQRIADLVSLVRPQLTVVDAVRTLMNHGPTGGNLGDVRLTETVIASHDVVAADAYAATLFDLTGPDIAYVRAAAEMGLGTLDLDAIRVEEIPVG